MRNLYARLILWLIRPALERDSAVKAKSLPTLEEISAKITGATLDTPVQCGTSTHGPLYGAGLGEDLAATVRRRVEKELRVGGALWRNGAR